MLDAVDVVVGIVAVALKKTVKTEFLQFNLTIHPSSIQG